GARSPQRIRESSGGRESPLCGRTHANQGRFTPAATGFRPPSSALGLLSSVLRPPSSVLRPPSFRSRSGEKPAAHLGVRDALDAERLGGKTAAELELPLLRLDSVLRTAQHLEEFLHHFGAAPVVVLPV